MQPMFTIHAGEYLVGSYIEQNLTDQNGKKLNLWIPSKDTGIDLLVTDQTNRHTTSIQVKFSKDFLTTDADKREYQDDLKACGWWKLNPEKIRESLADYWILVLPPFKYGNVEYIIIPPEELASRLGALRGTQNKALHSYLWITENSKCWETRGLSHSKVGGLLPNTAPLREKGIDCQSRNFSGFLNKWEALFSHWS